MAAVPPSEHVVAWQPRTPGVREVFHARFLRHAYPAHTHSTWTVFLVDHGHVSYRLDRRGRHSSAGVVTVLPPHVTHDGRPATSEGFGKRVLYLDDALFGESLVGPAVDRPDVPDTALHRRMWALHRVLASGHDDLEAETRLAFVVERLRAHLGERSAGLADGARREAIAEHLRALLDAHVVQGVTLVEAGRLLHVSPAHAVRCFRETYGIAPHAYLTGRRVELARGRLLDGEPPARVAAAVGFYDQAHFTRHFKRHVGTTPGSYGRAARTRGGRSG